MIHLQIKNIRFKIMLLWFNGLCSCFKPEGNDFNGLRVNCIGGAHSNSVHTPSFLGESNVSDVCIINGVLQKSLECKGLFRVNLNNEITLFADGNFIKIYLNKQLEKICEYDKSNDIVEISSIDAFFPYSITLKNPSKEKIPLLLQPSLYKRIKLSIFFYPGIISGVILCFMCVYFTHKYTR
jgi:hypothetical protein